MMQWYGKGFRINSDTNNNNNNDCCDLRAPRAVALASAVILYYCFVPLYETTLNYVYSQLCTYKYYQNIGGRLNLLCSPRWIILVYINFFVPKVDNNNTVKHYYFDDAVI